MWLQIFTFFCGSNSRVCLRMAAAMCLTNSMEVLNISIPTEKSVSEQMIKLQKNKKKKVIWPANFIFSSFSNILYQQPLENIIHYNKFRIK